MVADAVWQAMQQVFANNPNYICIICVLKYLLGLCTNTTARLTPMFIKLRLNQHANVAQYVA